jgi:hypothetical protein
MSGCSCDQTTDEPAPSLHTHYRCFITTTSWSASASASVLDASQFPLLGALPLAPARPCGERALYRHTLSHVSCSSRRSDSRRLHAGHRLANKRAPARLFPELCTHPGFDAISYFSTLPQRFARARLPDPRLTALTPPFSSIAPHNGLQPMQHRGGLTPPPAGRRRRATNLHLLHNTASSRSTYTQPLSGVRGTRAERCWRSTVRSDHLVVSLSSGGSGLRRASTSAP